MSSKYGRIISYKTVFEEQIDSRIPEYKAKIQIAKREKTKIPTVQIWVKHTEISNKYGFSSYAPSYKGLRALMDCLVEVHGKAEVERELNIKIGGGKDGNGI
jgi:hypothetical protein